MSDPALSSSPASGFISLPLSGARLSTGLPITDADPDAASHSFGLNFSYTEDYLIGNGVDTTTTTAISTALFETSVPPDYLPGTLLYFDIATSENENGVDSDMVDNLILLTVHSPGQLGGFDSREVEILSAQDTPTSASYNVQTFVATDEDALATLLPGSRLILKVTLEWHHVSHDSQPILGSVSMRF